MKLTRREMLLTGLGLVVGGCASAGAPLAGRPRTDWPRASAPRRDAGDPVEPDPQPATPEPDDGPAGLSVIPRSRWASRGAVPGRVNAMNGVNRITVHHEGWTPVWFTDYHRTAKRIEHDRHVHVDNRGWGDLGYHYIIDRAGRLWQGRRLRYQGAHVADNNEHNIGVMCLGNFDKQQPSEAQLRKLIDTLTALRRQYDVPVSRVFTHQELNPTACPGANLQPRMVRIRRGGYLA